MDSAVHSSINLPAKKKAARKNKKHLVQPSFKDLEYHYNNSPIGIIEWKGMQVSGWSKRAEGIFGWNEKEAVGKTAEELNIVFADDPEVANARKRVLNQTTTIDKSVNRNRHKNGHVIYCEWHSSVLRNGIGEIIQVITFVQDVTANVVAGEALKKNRNELEKVYNSVSDFLFSIGVAPDSTFTFLMANQAFLASVQLNEEELRNRPLEEVLVPENVPIMVGKCKEAVAARTMIEWESITYCHGKKWTGWMRLNPVFDEDGDCYLIVGSMFDISEKVQLQAEHKKMNELVQASTNAISITDGSPERHFTFLNDAARLLYGFEDKQGKYSSLDIMEEEELKRLQAIAVQHSGHLRNVASYFVHFVSKVKIPVLISSYPISVEGVNMIVGIVTDLREIRQAQTKLEAAYNDIKEYASHLQIVREEEREFLAREVHDELGQLLTAIKMDVFAALSHLQSGTQDPRLRLQDSLLLLDESIGSVRKIVSDLHPHLLADLGLPEAIKTLCAATQKKAALKIRTQQLTSLPRFDSQVELAIYRIVQEALTNIQKHAFAKNAWVLVNRKKDSLTIAIKDDGIGLASGNLAPRKSLGVIGMKERAALFGGSINLQPAKGSGTEVVCHIPL